MHRRAVIVLAIALIAVLAFLWSVDDSPEVEGVVEDEHGPVNGAIIRFKGRPQFTHTDASGHFRLPRIAGANRVTAAKEGFFIGGSFLDAGPLRIRLHRLPAEDCERYAWRDPTPEPSRPLQCGNCHQEIHREWAAGGHANASTNKHFLNIYDGSDWQGRPDRSWNLLKEHPDGAGVCAACHAPTAPIAVANDFDLRAAVKGLGALNGVHCDFCHKVRGPGRGEFGLAHGRFQLELLRPPVPAGPALHANHNALVFGPLDDVDRGEDAFSRFQRDSRLCAACHEGVVFGVPVYTTYSEWLKSPAKQRGQSCQSCHMAPTGKMTNIAPGKGGIERDPRTLGNHDFFAGSQLDMLRRCLKLRATARRTADGLRVDVSITVEGAGHRVPTGFADRQVILVVEPAGGDRRALQGPLLPTEVGKELAGMPGQLYAKLLRDFEGRGPVPFWTADPGGIVDTRLSPGATDAHSWVFPVETSNVRVRLLHRRFWQDVANEKNWPSNETVIFDQAIP